jgi:hypothetical protein
MKLHRRAAFLLGVLLLASSAFARQLPNIDAFANAKPNPANDAAVQARARNFMRAGTQLRSESRLGVPTFVWAGAATDTPTIHVGGNNTNLPAEEAAARSFVESYASLYNLNAADVSAAVLRDVHNTGKGGVIVKFKQTVGGIEIFREELNVLMTQQLQLVAFSGYISSTATPGVGGLAFSLDNKTAAGGAFADLTGRPLTGLIPAGSRGGYDYFTAGAGAGLDEPIRVKKVYFHLAGGLVPGYYIEVAAKELSTSDVVASDEAPGLDYYSYVISAVDGSILFRKNLTNDAKEPGKIRSNGFNDFTYRVWASNTTFVPNDEPTGNAVTPKVNPVPDGVQPPYVAATDVTLTNYPFFSRAATDPWLPPGATVTNGNNVDAYVDLDGTAAGANDGLTGTDFRATVTAPGQFLHTFDPTLAPTSNEQRQGALQQLFFNTNFLHDWYYDSGFDEAAGNAQAQNFGRGGVEGDSLHAEGQDGSGRNNANMSTPADGASPRMQMYVFDALLAKYFEVATPANIAGKRQVGSATLGPQSFDINNTDIVYAAPANACTALTNAAQAAGKIVIYERTTTCNFGTAYLNVQAANPAAIIMANLASTPDTLTNITGASAAFTKPWLTITYNMAQPIKAELALNTTVTGRARRDGGGIDRDGTIDNQVIFHEWGHYISNRLIANAAGLGQAQARGMGEGWGDFDSMMLSVRPDDVATPSNANWNGVYGMATYVTAGDNGFGAGNEAIYWGIRRYPYSTDMTKNPLTYKHIQNGVALPVGPPVGFGASGSNNSEVHNVGEVWAETLWECYASLLRDTLGATPRLTFQQAQDRMKAYYVASLKLTPGEPTILEARDAVLAAAYANDGVDYIEFWQAFAKRGMGVGAIGPDRYSVTHVGTVTESFVAGSDLQFVSAAVDDSVSSCDGDGYLDGGDTGKLTFTLRNLGTQTLTNTTGTVTSANPNVIIANGGAITFGPSDGSGTTTGSVNVSMPYGTAGIQSIDYTLNFTDSALSVPGSRTKSGALRGNVNVIPSATATDDIEAPATKWTTSANPLYNQYFPWTRTAITETSHQWHSSDVNGLSDQYLTSPVFTVDGSGSLNVQFDHSYSFEFDSGANYDGGKVEMSVNGGAYTDVSTGGTNGYNGNIAGPGGAPSFGPAFVKNSAGTIHTTLTAAIAPGSTVQVRFRTVSDQGVGATGWNVDNIAFTGVVETPFDVFVADPGCTTTTSTVVAGTPNPATFGSSVTITATVSSLHGTPSGGTVTFKDGASTIGSGPVVAGVATMNTSALAVGIHSLTAQYSGTAGFSGSNSAASPLTINKATTSIVLGSSLNPAGNGASVTFTATISSPAGNPAGSIAFLDGATPLASVAISGGVATYTTSALAPGSHSITATFATNASYSGSTSNTINQVVAYATSVGLGSDANPAFVGANVTITATITTTGSATGTVQFYDGATPIGSPAAIAGNAATYSSSSFTVGSHSITAVYGGDSTHGGSTSGPLSQVIDNLPVIALASATAHAVEGSGTIHITVNRTGVTTGASSVSYTTSDGTAVAGTDYTTSAGTLNFVAAQTTGTIDIVLSADDLTAENAKTITLTLSSPSGATLGTAVATVTILDNDTHVADFTADGSSDLVLRNYSNGANALWTLNGTAYASTVNLPALPNAAYHIVGIGDFDGDHDADILWRNQVTGQNAIWLMNGALLQGTVNLPGLTNTAYFVGGVGDFNGDGKTDILWQNHTTGALAVWIMNGTSYVGNQNLPTIPAAFKVAGVGDFNYDGKADIVVRNDTTGGNAVLLMNGLVYSSTVNLPTLTDLNYHFDGVGDLNNDGSADIVIRNYSTGSNAVWVMDGTSLTTIDNLPGLTNLSYEINGPR